MVFGRRWNGQVAQMSPRTQAVPQINQEPTSEPELESLYRIIIHNDDVTPMDFVVVILERIFFIRGSGAVDIMYMAHVRGAAYVQTLPKTEAQSRIGRAHFAAGLEGYPLHFTMEPE
jgi:ATP-dependent Clp protease adaptor protein ClpS